MRILFLEDQIEWICLLPDALRNIGHDVLISGPLTKQNISRMVAGFSPDLVIVTGWSHEHSPEKRNWSAYGGGAINILGCGRSGLYIELVVESN